MEWFEALILGLIQGLTEFLPVSSSGHLEIGKKLFNVQVEENLYFSILVHGATVLSTIVVFRDEILKLIKGTLKFQYNMETKYVLKIAVSMIPIVIVGFTLDEQIEKFFNGNIFMVGIMLLVTSLLLSFTYFFKRENNKNISYFDAFIIGIAQCIAVLPGISRSGATIATGLLIGNKKSDVAQFSFLMVLIPILGVNFLELISGDVVGTGLPISTMLIGFFSAFISGLFACKIMLKIVQNGKLIWFAIYCLVIGLTSIIFLG